MRGLNFNTWTGGILSRLKHFVSGRTFAGHDFGLSDLLLYAKMVDEGVILQTDGSFLSAFWFRGADLESSTDEELSALAAMLNNAFNLLGSGWMVHVDTIRYPSLDYTATTDCHFPDKISFLIDMERRELYQREGVHYENAYALNITYRPSIDFASKMGLFFYKKINESTASYNYSYYLKLFKQKLQEVTSLLTDQLNLHAMNSQELLSYISWCLTGENMQLKLPVNYGVFLKHYLACADLVGGEAPQIGKYFIKAVTVSGFPSESYPGILDKLNYVDFTYRLNTRFIFLNQHEGRKIIGRISNLWYQKRISAMDTIKMSLAIDSHIKVDRNSESRHQDAEHAQALNESGDVKFGFYTATVIIMDSDELVAGQKAEQIRTLFRSLGFQSQIERYHSLEAYLGTLPGYSYANVRKWLVHSMNVADILPNTAIWSGLQYNPCSYYPKNSPPLFYARTTGYTPVRISLHVGDNGHSLVVGPTGSGKSTLLNFIIAQHLRYKDARVFVFDKNRSSLPLCFSCNGNFFDLGADNNRSYFQPLALLETDLDFNFAASWLEELCILNGLGEKFSQSHREAIYKGLCLLKQEAAVGRRTISYFRHLVQDYDKAVATILDAYSSEKRTTHDTLGNSLGFVPKLFDSPADNLGLGSNNFNVFEMSILMNQGDRVIIPALRYLIHTISKQFDSAVPTLLVFDESFLFFKHPLFRERIIEWVKTVRKFNVAIIFATQELADLFKYEDLRSSLNTNCATKIFLPNRNARALDITVQYQAMGLNDKQIALITHLNRGEYLYVSNLANRRFSLDLESTPATYTYVARTSSQDIKRALALKAQVGDNNFAEHWRLMCSAGN